MDIWTPYFLRILLKLDLIFGRVINFLRNLQRHKLKSNLKSFQLRNLAPACFLSLPGQMWLLLNQSPSSWCSPAKRDSGRDSSRAVCRKGRVSVSPLQGQRQRHLAAAWGDLLETDRQNLKNKTSRIQFSFAFGSQIGSDYIFLWG